MTLHDYVAEEIALDCNEGLISRREALRRLGLLGLSAVAATTLLAACAGDDSNDAASTTTAPASTDETPTTTAGSKPVGQDVTFPGPRGELKGSWAAADTPKGAVLVIHENRGLTEHIKTIPPRLAAEGYSALAIDLLSEEGGTPADEGQAQSRLGSAPEERFIADLKAGVDELVKRVPGKKVAAMGFCFGGGLTWRLLHAGEPRLAAAAPFYGPAPDQPDFSKSKAAVLGIYAGNDARVNGSRDAAEAALTKANLTHEIKTYPGVDHAFFNDTGPRYNAEAADQAWKDVLAWFAKYVD